MSGTDRSSAEEAVRSLLPLLTAREINEVIARELRRGIEGAIWVASHPITPAETLRALAQHPRAEVREVVAANPSTPAEVREALLSDRSSRVRLAASEQVFPGCVSGEITLLGLLGNPEFGLEEVERLVVHYQEQISADDLLLLTRHRLFSEFSGETVSALLSGQEDSLAAAKALEPYLSDRQCMGLLESWPWMELTQLSAMVGIVAKRFSTKQVRSLALDPSWRRRMIAAVLPEVPAVLLQTLLADEDADVAGTAVRNPSMRLDLLPFYFRGIGAHFTELDELAKRWGVDRVRGVLQLNPGMLGLMVGIDKTSPIVSRPEALLWLSESTEARDRFAAAGEADCPKEILERLLADPDPSVRLAVFSNKNAPRRAVIQATYLRRVESSRLAVLRPVELLECSAGMVLEALTDWDSNCSEEGRKLRPRVLRLLRQQGVFTREGIEQLITLSDGFTGSLGDLFSNLRTLQVGR